MSVDLGDITVTQPVILEGDELRMYDEYKHDPQSPLTKEQLFEYCKKFNIIPDGADIIKLRYENLWRKFIHHRYNIDVLDTIICWECLKVIGDREHPAAYSFKQVDTKLRLEKSLCQTCYKK